MARAPSGARRARAWCAAALFAPLLPGVASGAAGAAAAGAAGAAAGAAPPTILILESYHRGFRWTDQETDGALAALRARWPDLQPLVESLDLKRHGAPAEREAAVRRLQDKLAGRRLDGVIVTDNGALEVALARRAELLGAGPIAFAGVNGFDPAWLAGQPRLSGVVEDVDVAGTLALVRALQPDLRTLVVALDRTETSGAIEPRVRAAATALGPGVALRVESDLSLPELEGLAAGLDRRSALLLGSFSRDRLGDFHGYEAVADRVAARSGAPVYGLWEFQLGHGVVGGSLLSGEAQGRRAGELLLRLLDGEADVPVDLGAAARLVLDDAVARRLGLELAGRPAPGPLTVLHAAPGAWEGHRTLLSALLALVGALLLGALALLAVLRRIRRGERALQESERHFRELANMLPQVVYEADAQGRLVFVNRQGFKAFGYDPEELERGLELSAFVAPQDRARASRNIGAVMGGAGGGANEYAALRRDGTTFPVAIYSAPIMRDGRPAGLLGLIVDIRERLQAEEARLELQRRLDDAQRLEAIGRLAGGVAHDFNNLLTPIMGEAEAALEALGHDHEVAPELRGILEAAGRAGALTRQLLAFGRRQVLEARPVDLNAEVASLHVMLRRVIGEDVEVRLALAPGPVVVNADPAQIQQVLLNLAVNARDAMPGGGVLTLATRVVPAGRAPAVAGAPPPDLVELTVADTGVGMTEAVRARLFEPFFSTKPPGKGSGLGLATVLGVVQQHGGSVEVRSAPGQGTTFRLLLPRAAGPLAASLAPGRAPAPATRPLTILLAEDETAVRRLVEGYLSDAGHAVLSAADGEEALARARAHPGVIDLLVSDVVMPGMNGRQLLEALLVQRPGIKVVFMSGYPALPGTQEEIVAGGPGAVLAKPFTREELRERVALATGGAPP